MSLTDSQALVLLLWFLRDHLDDITWEREWRDGMIKRGKIDGNRSQGRIRTWDSLLKLGLLSAQTPEDSMYPDRWTSVLTEKGREVVYKISPKVAAKLPYVARIKWFEVRGIRRENDGQR